MKTKKKQVALELKRILLEFMEYKGWIIINPTKEDFERLLDERI